MTRVLGAKTRRVHVTRQGCAASFARSLRPAVRTCRASGSAPRESEGVTDRGSPAPSAVTQRRPTQPASFDAGEQRGESPTRARGDDGSIGCARVSNTVAEVDERRPGLERRGSLARARADGGPALHEGSDALGRGAKRVANRWSGQQRHDAGKGPSRASERASRGKGLRSIEGTPVTLSAHLVHAGGLGAISAALDRALGARAPGALEGEATRVSEARPHARRREDNARRGDPSKEFVRPAKAQLHCREAGDDPGQARASDRSRPTGNRRDAGTDT